MDTSTQADSAGAADTSLTGFYAGMSMPERRTFWACAAGWALDGMDFMIYPLIIGTIMQQWSVLPGQAGLAATATLLTSAAGGWAAGFLADRIGRVRTMQITILWFSLFSLLCAFAQSFNQLMVLRALLGFGFGGEWAAGAVLLGETIRPEFRGRAVGCVQSAWAVGWAAAVLVQIAIFSVLPPETAWRAMLAAGCLPALLVVYLRRSVKEPEVAAAARSALARSGDQPGMARIFAPALLRTTVLASLLCMGAQGGYYAISTWLPQFLRTTRGLTILNSTPYLAVLIAGSFVGYLVGAWLVDRIGRRPTFMIFSIGAVTLVLAYTQLQIGNGAMLVLGFPLGFFASGYFSGIGPLLTELYPTAVRGSGQGFCYSFGRGIGALFPALVGYLSQTMSLANAMGLFAVMAYGLLFLAALLLPETRGRALVADA
jgi:MFS family permease